MLLAGLMDWIGDRSPTSEDLAGRSTVSQGQIHLKSIWQAGSEVLGNRSLSQESIVPNMFLSESPGDACKLMVGYEILRAASAEEQQKPPVFSTWGYLVIQHKAESLAAAVWPNPSVKGTSASGLCPLAAAPYLER
jgi:hypothetical protein